MSLEADLVEAFDVDSPDLIRADACRRREPCRLHQLPEEMMLHPHPRSLVIVILLAGCSPGSRDSAPPADTAFAALQERGKAAMGVDQYTSSHIFESLTDGGRIVLQRDSEDSAGTAVIRAHMADIASRFTAGDFTIPGMVHAREVPGTAIMTERASRIRYTADTLPRGGQLRVTTNDSVAIGAIHEFMAFQRMDHRAEGHDH